MTPVRATYRLQLRGGVGFREAAAAVPYLARLGISHLYASPVLAARAGSTHGYDVIDPTRLDPALGSRTDLDALCASLADAGLGLVLDIVPNHMAASLEGPWWRDLLTHGRESAFAAVFDVDWEAPGLDGRLLVPVLGMPLEQALAAGEVTVDPPIVRIADGLELPMRPGTHRLDEQAYLLAHWRDANVRVDYRRFFDIPDLVGVRVDDPSVFEPTHALLLDLVRDGCVQGLRIDHVDGLRDPLGYLRRLREAVGPDVPIWVEKILGPDEQLPPSWPVEGTTGYELAAAALDALVDRGGLAVLARRYPAGDRGSFADVARAGKRDALVRLLAPDVLRVTRALTDPLGRELESLAPELVDAAVALPVYRTYVRPGDVAAADRALLADAVPDEELRAALLLDVTGATDGALRFQQLTSPAMAKGVEDTALYRHAVLAARNEVGAHPGEAPGGPDTLQEALAARAVAWPSALAALATHDSKRGPDVRARLLVLAELGEAWVATVDRLEALEAASRAAGAPEVDANARWLLWQTLVGAWPLAAAELPVFAERVRDYALKAARESKERTTWTEPDEAYEAALADLVARALDPAGALHEALAAEVERIAWPGAVNGLSLALLLLAAPGLPDVYQGTERWALTLVDPDNRRPVDLAALDRDLAALDGVPASALVPGWRDGRLKQLVVARTLQARRADPALFARGACQALDAGPDVLAFARELDGRWAVCAVPRSPLRRPPGAVDLALPAGAPRRWTDVLEGVAQDGPTAFAALPVTLLVGEIAD